MPRLYPRTFLTSSNLAETADSSLTSASCTLATILASVVLPVPGSPQRMALPSLPCSMSARRTEPSPRTASWPRSSRREVGRRASASGRAARVAETLGRLEEEEGSVAVEDEETGGGEEREAPPPPRGNDDDASP